MKIDFHLLCMFVIKKYTDKEYKKAKSTDKLKLQCLYCKQIFNKEKKHITHLLKCPRKKTSCEYCSKKCCDKNKIKKKKMQCKHCNKNFEKRLSQIKKTKNHFCTMSCAAIYRNTHKKYGTRRSKLEIWLEEQLPIKCPDLEFIFNGKEAIESELDIYIPSLNLAFELNGIFHYEPIFGKGKLEQTQNNDKNKFKACIDKKIDLCIIDVSQQKYVKPSTSQKYLDIIINIIQERVWPTSSNETALM